MYLEYIQSIEKLVLKRERCIHKQVYVICIRCVHAL